MIASSSAPGGWGYSAYLDEYEPADHLEARILLKDGATAPVEDPNQYGSLRWAFRDGSTLLDMREADAIAAVQRALAEADRSNERPSR